MMALDIGVRSRLLFKSVVEQAATVIWNGPLGVYEFGKFAVGTKSLMDSLVETSSKGSTVIVCGVDTCQACRIWGTEEKLTHVSTGLFFVCFFVCFFLVLFLKKFTTR